jgi:hypothetical protein
MYGEWAYPPGLEAVRMVAKRFRNEGELALQNRTSLNQVRARALLPRRRQPGGHDTFEILPYPPTSVPSLGAPAPDAPRRRPRC